jgi:hypothetical protein
MAGRRKTVNGHPDRRSARLTQEQRVERDALILQLYLAGRPLDWIAKHPRVTLSMTRVHEIIHRELQALASNQGLAREQALTIYTARLETLIGRVWPQVAEGNLKAIEVSRRLLEQYARLYDLNDERNPVTLTPPMSDDELSMLDEASPAFQQLDDLTKYRLKQHRENQGFG